MASNDQSTRPGSCSEPKGRTIGDRIGSILVAMAAIGAVLVGVAAFALGGFTNALFLAALVMAPLAILARCWWAFRGRLEYGLLRRPASREMRPYLAQLLNRWLFWGLAGVTLVLAAIPFQFETAEYRSILAMIGGAMVLLMILQLIPRNRVRLSTNLVYALGWLFLAMEWGRVFLVGPAREPIVLEPPFRGEWGVVQGGDSALINHHYPIPAQRHALDLVKLAGGRDRMGDPNDLASYPSFGAPLYAPADGRVVRVVGDRRDEAIGESDREILVGNHVVIEIGRGRFVLLAHLKSGSVRVAEGDRVRRGEWIARCGNSGNTSSPHLHLQVQNRPDFEAPDLRTVPMTFRGIRLVRRGRSMPGKAVVPRRSDRIIVEGP